MNSTINTTFAKLSETLLSPTHYQRSLIRPILSTIVLCLVVYQLIKYFTSDLPPFGSGLKRLPGPISTVPYLGRIHDVDRMHAWDSMKKFSDQYDGLFSCTLGGETHIWVAREDIAQDLLCKNAAISSARGDLGAYPGVTQDRKYLPLLGYTKHLIRQKKFAHAMVTRNVDRKYYGHISLEAKRFLHEILMRPEDFFDLIPLFCARVSARLAYGDAQSAPEHVRNAGTFISQLGPSGPITNLVPLLRFLPELLVPDIRTVRLRQEAEERLWRRCFTEAENTMKEGQHETYTNASLRTKAGGNGENLLFEDKDEAMYAVGMLCTVSIFTIGGPAVLFVLAMVLHPEWQRKIREEIDIVVSEEMVDLKHSPQLPTLRAAILEAIRWRTTVPLGVPRLLEKNYTFDGYHFPKDAVVHVLDIALSRDPERYLNPSEYNPGRWLDEKSPNYKTPLTEYPRLKGHHIFGRGRRMCPGQDLAEAELFVLCGNLLKFFDLRPKLDRKGNPIWPDPDRWGTDVIGGPLPFECNIEIRDEGKRICVERAYFGTFGDKIQSM
ncbi:cytochrome P450 oxidoreductase [Clohesyomyces aquaticus]|uniref:Cytochrome P450 oxidoreductase n=1 Tax=Clohesyomyces aquaticus TaxID=1231657 RepID=A0A1Y2A7B9_9PLEO|nr:cytochrome P450 oxidoreductase [Clohesyomyces aquaticus]